MVAKRLPKKFSQPFHTNIDAVVAAAEKVGRPLSDVKTQNALEGIIRRVIKQNIYEIFQYGATIANKSDGFPQEFTDHMLETVSQLEPLVDFDSMGVTVQVDLKQLGDYKDLTKAYHQGAQLEGGGTLHGPYTGQALKQDDAGTRHTFWEAMRSGESSVNIDGKNIPIRDSLWEETINQYLRIWGEQSPQWLFIQFGQKEWKPFIHQFDIFHEIKSMVGQETNNIIAQYLRETVELANKYKTTGLDVGWQGPKQTPRVLSGFAENAGKVYRPGRFASPGGLK